MPPTTKKPAKLASDTKAGHSAVSTLTRRVCAHCGKAIHSTAILMVRVISFDKRGHVTTRNDYYVRDHYSTVAGTGAKK